MPGWCAAAPRARVKPALQPGNSVHVQWRARLAEHLGSFTCELARARAGEMMDSRERLAGLNAFTASPAPRCPNARPMRRCSCGAEVLLDAMTAEDALHWMPLYVRWEAACWRRWASAWISRMRRHRR